MTKDTFDGLLDDGSDPKKDTQAKAKGTIGGYTLIRELGVGGMGTVYEAEQEGLKRRVALKILLPHLSTATAAIQRFMREGEAAGRQQHPNTVAVYDIGEDKGVHYIAQELIPGGVTLKDRLKKEHQILDLPADHYEQLGRFFIKCADALQHAHDGGVVHRDVKPANILLMPDGEPKVTDFGLAMVEDALSLSRTGQIAGTPYYMSPEQAASRRMGIDHRSDVFSLGVTLYEALTYTLAFTGDTSQQVIEKILLDDPVNPCTLRSRVPVELSAICLKAMEKKREHRYQSMTEFSDDLRRFLNHEPIQAKPPGLVRRSVKWMRRHPVWTATMLVATVAFCIVSGLLWQLDKKSQALQAEVVVTEAALWESRGFAEEQSVAGLSLAAMRTSLYLIATPERLEQVALQLSRNQPLILGSDTRLVNSPLAASPTSVSPDGNTLLTTSLRESTLWNLITGEKIVSVKSLPLLASAAKFTPDGKEFVVVDNYTIVAMDLETREILYKKKLPKRLSEEGLKDPQRKDHYESYAFSLENQRLVAITQKGSAHVWDLAVGTMVRSFPIDSAVRQNGLRLRPITFTSDGKSIIVASDSTLFQWDITTGQKLKKFEGTVVNLTGLSTTPDGTRVVSVNYNGAIKVWDTESGELVYERNSEETGGIVSMAISPDGKMLATGSSNHSITLWNLERGLPLQSFVGHEDNITSLEFTSDNQRLVAVSQDHTISVWRIGVGLPTHLILETKSSRMTLLGENRYVVDVGSGLSVKELLTGQELFLMPKDPHRRSTSLSSSIDGSYLATYERNGSGSDSNTESARNLSGAWAWDLQSRTKAPIHQSKPFTKGKRGTSLMSPDGDGVLVYLNLLSANPDTLTLYDRVSGDVRFVIESASTVREIATNGVYIFGGTFEGEVLVWDYETGEHLHTLKGHAESITHLALSDNGEHLITGSQDRTAVVWDLQTMSLKVRLKGHKGGIKGGAFTPDGEYAVTSSRDDPIKIWDLASGRVVRVLDTKHRYVKGMAADETMVTSSYGHYKVWDIGTVDSKRRTASEAIIQSGAATNYRACRQSREIIPVVPFPDPETIWAPEELCQPQQQGE